MRRTRLAVAAAALLFATPAFAHESCGCRDREVLNGRIDTAGFDGGVGDRFGDGGYAPGGGYTFVYGGASAGAFAAARASAFASASSHGFVSSHTSFHAGGGYGGHH